LKEMAHAKSKRANNTRTSMLLNRLKPAQIVSNPRERETRRLTNMH
jgi:hypothetical protein